MNTVTVQLNDKQYDLLQALIPYAMDRLEFLVSVEGDNENRDDFNRELEGAGEVAGALSETKSYLWTSSLGEVDLDISAEHIDAICHSGDNEPACRAAIEEDGYLRAQLNAMDLDKAREYLKDAGIEDVDSKDDDLVRTYILWMAAWDIHEERNMED